MKRIKVMEINEGACSKAGINRYDILDTYNGVPLDSSDSLASVMSTYSGQPHCLEFIRSGQLLRAEVVAGPLGIVVNQVDFDVEYTRRVNGMHVSTTPFIPGHKITSSIDVITAECAFGMNIFKDFLAGMSDFFGGRSGVTQKVLKDARKTCLYELRVEAESIGANAIAGIDLDYSEFSGQGKSMLFLVASGTAVTVEPE